MFEFKKMILIVAVFAVLFSACIRQSDASDYVKSSAIEYLDIEHKDTTKCIVMKCIEKEPWSLLSFGSKTVPSLYKGSCEFITYKLTSPTQKSAWVELLSPKLEEASTEPSATGGSGVTIVGGLPVSTPTPEKEEQILIYPRLFMFGAGDSIVMGDEAQRFCNGNLGFTIHDLGGHDGTTPSMPQEEGMECSLKSNIIPMYLYRSATGAAFHRNLASAASGNGPVIIAPEPELSFGENPTKVEGLAGGVFREIKTSCSECMTAAVVKFGDEETVRLYQDNPNIDMMGYKLDVKDFDTCTPKEIVSKAVNFSEYMIDKTGNKSSIIYMNVTEGKSNVADCIWDKEKIVDFYGEMTKAIPDFVLAGTAGIGIYDSESLNSYEAFNAWFRNCQNYYRLKDSKLSYATPIAFVEGGDTGTSECRSKTLNTALFIYEPPTDFSNKVIPVTKTRACGDICFDSSEYPAVGGSFQYQKCNSQDRFYIRQYAFENGVDPNIIMAIIDQHGGVGGEGELNLAGLFGKIPACLDYEGRAGSIRCVAESFATHYRKAGEKFGSNDAEDQKWRSYYAIVGTISGSGALSDGLAYHDSGVRPGVNADNILSSSNRIKETCGFCLEEDETSLTG